MRLAVGTYLQRGKYRIEKVLGQGSFGITYLASVNLVGELGSLPTNTMVAIKEFFMRDINGRIDGTVTSGSKDGIFSNYKRRFIKEARTLSKLNHPNIIHVLDLFEQNNTVYYVMEYLDGGSLDKLIADKSKLTPQEAIMLIRQIGNALDYMHSHKMVHLDLKPANVMLNKKGEAVLIDFGLTKEFDELGNPESSTTIGHGTLGYAPIEQANYQRGHGIPVTMDIYALGATLYKMLTGQRPPVASEVLNEGVEILSNDIIKNSGLDSVIIKAMAPMKIQRYQTIGNFLTSLQPESSQTATQDYPKNTISFLIVRAASNLIYYYRGTVYSDLEGGFMDIAANLNSLKEVGDAFKNHFTKVEELSLNSFINKYQDCILYSDKCIASYLDEEDYYRLLSYLSDSSIKVNRLTCENRYVTRYLANQLAREEHLKRCDNEGLYSLRYDNTEIKFEYCDNWCRILEGWNLDTLQPIENSRVRKYVIKTSENLRNSLLWGFISTYKVLTYRRKEELLIIDSFPFELNFGPKWGNFLPQFISPGTSIPAMHSEKFDFIGTDYLSVKVGRLKYDIDVSKYFGYVPKYIKCEAVIYTCHSKIAFKVKDTETGKEVSYDLKDLRNPKYT